MQYQALSSLQEGESRKITAILPSGTMAERLRELGFTAGTEVTCLQRSFSGDPTAYFVKGTVIALRKTDADSILVRS